MAVDWFSGLVGYDASELRFGQVWKVSPDGEVTWSRDSWEKAEGSYASSVQVSRDVATPGMRESADEYGFLCSPVVLRVSGNPTKFLQGHNVFGPSVASLGPVIQGLARNLPEPLRPRDAQSEAYPAVHRSRVDVAVAVDLGGHEIVHDWLRQAELQTRSRHGRAMASGSTVYWGKSSRRWSMKAYCKFCELVDHPPEMGAASLARREAARGSPIGTPVAVDLAPLSELREACEGHLRLELTLRRPELKDRGTLSEDVVWEFYEKVVIGVQKELFEVERKVASYGLPAHVRDALLMWLDGRTVTHLWTRTTFWRRRRQIMDVVGVDISLPRNDEMSKLERIGFDVEYLKSRQVKDVPAGLQKSLFRVPAVTYERKAG